MPSHFPHRGSALLAALVAIGLVALASHGNLVGQVAPQVDCPSCEDFNACTTDSCDTTTGTCRHDPVVCDDGNPCTSDTCYPYGPSYVVGCQHFSLTAGTACQDGNSCTTGDACDGSGRCAGTLLLPGSACDDGQSCTAGDLCAEDGTCAGTAMPAGAECDDRDACTRGERCAVAEDGRTACRGGEVPICNDGLACTIDSCDPITGDCVNRPFDCNDGNPCTEDACDPGSGACTHDFLTGSCDDRNICTVNTICVDGNCTGGEPDDCGWGDQCGFSFCIPQEQRCLTDTSPSRCPPAGQCQYNVCRNGICASESVVSGPCTDGNPCTLEMCVRGGCTVQLILDGSPCDDSSACTAGDVCRQVSCTGTPTCTDGDACTTDLCDPATGVCLGSQPLNCDDGNPCTTDSCDPAIGCVHSFSSSPCDDRNACTTGDVCGNGSCRGALSVVCADDGNPCTYDQCDPGTGTCVHPANFASCNDGNPCTVSDYCRDGACQNGAPKSCNDSNACTEDSCDSASGACLHRNVSSPCTDNNACTEGDACADGVCRPGQPTNCDDGNACTTDGCFFYTGCNHTAITGACDDGNPCTTGDACRDGVCRPTDPVSCIDGNACTIDSCDRVTGACVHETTGTDCDDGNACTIDLCDPVAGGCLGNELVDCDDLDRCTADSCDPVSGCGHAYDAATCPQEAVDLVIAFASPIGRGSGTLRWRTTYEYTLGGFHILVFDSQGAPTRLNDVLIPCAECVTGAGTAYEFIVPKHRSGRGVYVQVIGRDGSDLGTFGPATRER